MVKQKVLVVVKESDASLLLDGSSDLFESEISDFRNLAFYYLSGL